MRGKKGVKKPRPASMSPGEVKKIRESLGLTQDGMAAELGVQPLAISRWETGSTPVSQSRAMAIQALVARLGAGTRKKTA